MLLLEFAEKHVAADPSAKFLVVHGATKNYFLVVPHELRLSEKIALSC